MEDTGRQDVKGKKQQFVKRMKIKRPNLDYDDEDALYGSINDDYTAHDGELEEYKESEEKLVEAFDKNPRVANIFLAMTKGKNPLLYLIGSFGQKGIRAALGGPETKERIVERQNAYLERQAKSSKLEEEAKMSTTISLDALEEAKNDLGCSDEDAGKAFKLFAQVQGDAIVDRVTKETWIIFSKGLNRDIDIKNAIREAEIKERNAKIDKDRREKAIPDDIPPQLGGQGVLESRTGKKMVIEGALARYSDDDSDDIWERGRKV